MRKNTLVILYSLTTILSYAQRNIPTGSWRTHYSFNTTNSISQSAENIYAASFSGLFIIDKSDHSISSITSLNGLSETGISQIDFNSTTNTLVITFENGQIDLLKDNLMSSITDIKSSDVFDSKITHHIYEQDEYSYLSTDFGVVKIDTKNSFIQNSFLKLSSTGHNLKINASTIYNDSLFIATENGVMVGSLSENLKDFSKWKRFDLSLGIEQLPISVISHYKDKPIVGSDSQGVLLYENGKWNTTNELIGYDYKSMEESGNGTIITTSDGVFIFKDDVLVEIKSEFLSTPSASITDNQRTWVADIQNGIVKIDGTSSESIYPNGPFFNNIVKVISIDEKVFAIPEFSKNNKPIRSNKGFSLFENGIWQNYNSTGFPKTISIPDFLDISSVSSSKKNNLIFSSYGYGLMDWSDDTFLIIDESNSPLSNSNPPNRNVFIADIAIDDQANWVLNNDVTNSLHNLTFDGTWSSFSPSESVATAKHITSTPWGDQWITLNSDGIIVFNHLKGEIKLHQSGSGSIPSNNVNQILLDREDKIWIATDRGIVYYSFPYSIFDDSSQEAIIPIIDSRTLFNGEKVNTIAVDGGNRMWMGTDKGAWLFDKDGSVLINHFTTENSPLLSDVVTAIAINNLSGEVFINTSKGLISYKGSATVTGTFERPKIYPNPVTPAFVGVVTIEGVPTDSNIKITDSSGRLVINLQANGNAAIWDIKNEFKTTIGTGVYFVFVSSSEGTDKQIGKIAVLK